MSTSYITPSQFFKWASPTPQHRSLRHFQRCQPPQAALQHPEIDLIITDVDGTLLNSRQQLTPGVEAAVRAAADAGVPLVVATGKAIGPWTHRILPRLATTMPQIFLQGLLIRDDQEGIILSRYASLFCRPRSA